MQLTKSDYMLYLRHPAWLWVRKHDPSKIPPVDENTQAMFDLGNRFEPYAESLFPEGVSLGFSDYDEYLSLPERTIQAIKSGAKVLFQPRFVWNEFTCISDIDKSTIASVVKSIKIDEFNAQLQKEAANIEHQKSLEAKLKEQELIDRSKVALSKKDQASCPRRLNRNTMGHYLIQWVFYLEATKALVTMVLKFSDIFSVQKQRQRKISWLKN